MSAKTPKTPKIPASPKTTVLVRMPQELVTALDSEVERLRALDPAYKTSRSEVLRQLVSSHLIAVDEPEA
jgi:metal-responsive CopG/Arc/MetJ family transcriptional regulator